MQGARRPTTGRHGRWSGARTAHNDPNSAFPDNDFVAELVPFLEKIGRI